MTVKKRVGKDKLLNKDYKGDVQLSTQFNRWTLKPIGAWPKPIKHSWVETLWSRLLYATNHSLLAFTIIPTGIYIVLEMDNFYDQVKIGGAVGFYLMAAMKYCALIIRENDLRYCLELIEADWKRIKQLEDRTIMLENANFGRKVIIICGAFMYGGFVFYYIAVPLSQPKMVDEESNLTFRTLVHPIPKVIIDDPFSSVNQILYAFQLLSGLVAHNITVAGCGLAALLVMHTCGQLQVLMAWLENLVDGRDDDNETFDERLANIVEQHVRVINFISLTENLLQEISFIEMAGCTFNICILGYFTMMEWDSSNPVSGMTFTVLLVSVTFNIFIFCYIGELLADQTTKVGEKSYMIDWYRIPSKKSLSVIMMISMSNSTPKFTAGNLITLSIGSFGDVMKSSVAYLNMLRTFIT